MIVPIPKLGDQAYRVLRRMIVAGELQQGERITERMLAARLGISPTPVREALQQLERERLIERRGPRTLMVTEPNRRRLRELRLVEAALRGVAARLAAEAATDEELNDIARIHSEALRVTEPNSGKREDAIHAIELTRQFHAGLDAAAHNPVLVDMIATATAFDFGTRLAAVERLGTNYPRQWGAEHLEILQALQSRDGDRAEELMRAHILRTGDYLTPAVDEASTKG